MNLISGILSGVLAVSGGLGISQFAEEDTSNQDSVIQEQAIGVNQRSEMMDADEFENMELVMEDGVVNFGQMKSHISEMHPELNNQQLREHYKGMHGTGGSSRSNNFSGMHQ
ncbi:hypothetical protein [Alkalibacterium sp. 20]|uniref:hypothetical protein n=1 Tax=Alkalibacterium sp. 20 TaxID=1798803 RepID=UPI0009004E62|nr:hypothetical protein [Alkalibacterium sp. 20]OJF90179.1 hypothetical protein AX762_04715 [Alkalibacterium sp. 20]